MNKLDPRLHAYRAGLADARLRSRVESASYSEGETRQLRAPIAALHREPRFDSMQLSQVLMGERVRVFDSREGWAWVQLELDGYVGYVAEDMLAECAGQPTHRVCVPSTFMFPAPSIKSQPVVVLPMNASLTVVSEDDKFAGLANGQFVFRSHLKPQASFEPDFVEVAEKFLHAPYLWGGKSIHGLDCSGLVQLALQAAGRKSPRDSDMQQEALGRELHGEELSGLRRGDLVFWDGHVAVMVDDVHVLHANGTFMQVTRETLRSATERIASSYGSITAVKRIQ